MKLKDTFPFEGWQILRDSFVDTDIDLQSQLELLTEDMFQAQKGQMPQNIVIDIGWYGESHTTEGKFKIYVIKNQDWTVPLFEYSLTDHRNTIEILRQVVKLIDGLGQT